MTSGRALKASLIAAFVATWCMACGSTTAAAGQESGDETAVSASCTTPSRLPPPVAQVPGGENGRRLPVNSVTHHRLRLPGRTLCFRATAGTVHLKDGQSLNEIAEVAYISYELEGADQRARPVAFVMNGGPGNSSSWLQLGGIGPWRLPMQGDARAPSALPVVVDNADTWLDFTDLVFIDPVGTGYSRSLIGSDETKQRFYAVNADIDSLAVFVWRWLDQTQRLASPKFIVGESYSGFRGPRLTHTLQTERGVGVNGLILISPVLDFGRFSGNFNTLDWVAHLPSFAATAMAKKAPVTRADLVEVERYARGEYLDDLMRGINDRAAVERIVGRVTALTGLDRTLVASLAGRVPAYIFQREIDRRDGKVTSVYDGTVTGYNPTPDGIGGHFEDPLSDAMNAPMTGAMVDLYVNRLGWRMEGTRYYVSNMQVNRSWDWGRGEPEAITDLRKALALDPHMQVLITHGLSDLITPYFETKMLLDQIPAFGSPDRLRLAVYPGGHMQYIQDEPRKALRSDARALIESARPSQPAAQR